MHVVLKGFGGRAPRIDAQLLPDNAAQVATNTKLWRGLLQPFRATSQVATPAISDVLTIYRFGDGQPETQYWFAWDTDVDVARGPVAGDVSERTYYTGDGVPKVTDNTLALTGGGDELPLNSYTLGVPAPTTAIAPTVSGTAAANALTETRAYVYTFVSAWGEESKPSPASILVDVMTGQTVQLTGMDVAPTGNYNVTHKRIYRTNTGNENAAYQFLAEIPVATTTYNDTLDATDLGEPLSSLYYDMPPSDMKGLIALPNAGMAGFSGNEVCFSEPGLPHAWPRRYRLTMDFPVVGLGQFGNTVVALTTGNPYLINGVEPESMSAQKMELQQACVSKRSIVNTGDAVLYASPDGIVSVGINGVVLITGGIMTRDDWQAYKPESIHAYFHEGRYIAFYDTGETRGGFVLDPANQQFYDLSLYATAGFNDLVNDALFLCIDDKIVKWEGAETNLTYTWKSKKFVLPHHVNFSAGIVHADDYPVTVKVYADGELKHTHIAQNQAPFRLPAGFLAKTWEFELSGTNAVYELQVATSIAELRSR